MDISEEELEVLRAAFDWARAGSDLELDKFLLFGGPVNLTNGSGVGGHEKLPIGGHEPAH